MSVQLRKYTYPDGSESYEWLNHADGTPSFTAADIAAADAALAVGGLDAWMLANASVLQGPTILAPPPILPVGT